VIVTALLRRPGRLETLPVIEQAKGIIMGQSHCDDAQAFDLLRRASQRGNVPVRELAAQIVAKAVQVPPRPVSNGHQDPHPLLWG
jgi:AmiR/NasT family two-component response regulator